jgi:hypothetical protein
VTSDSPSPTDETELPEDTGAPEDTGEPPEDSTSTFDPDAAADATGLPGDEGSSSTIDVGPGATSDPDSAAGPWNGVDNGHYDGQDYGDDSDEECPSWCHEGHDDEHSGYDGDDHDHDHDDDDKYPRVRRFLNRFRRRRDTPYSGSLGSFDWPSGGKKQNKPKCPASCYGSNKPGGSYKPSKSDGYKPDSKPDGYKPDGYKTDSKSDGYKTDSKSDGYKVDPKPDGYKVDPKPDGYKVDPKPDGYKVDPPVDGYKPDPPVDGYKPGPTPEGYHADSKPDGYKPDSPPDGYKPEPTPEGYHADAKPDGYEPHAISEPAKEYPDQPAGYTPTTFVTIATSEPYAYSAGHGDDAGHSGDSLADVCPKTCNPFDPSANKCDATTSCTTTGSGKYYCACRAGYKASAWNAKDFSKQFKFAGQPYVYTAEGVVCDQVCTEYGCSDVMERPQCK